MCTPTNLSSDRNLFFNTKDAACYLADCDGTVFSYEDGKCRLDTEANSVVADPLFRDPHNGDFTLAENSPAFRLGFRKIDMTNVGCTLK